MHKRNLLHEFILGIIVAGIIIIPVCVFLAQSDTRQYTIEARAQNGAVVSKWEHIHNPTVHDANCSFHTADSKVVIVSAPYTLTQE